jgi:uncharacterized protein YhaN
MGFMNLVEKSLDREDWESELKELTDQRDRLQRQLNSTRLKLATLDIPESEFQEAPAADEYSKESLEGFKLEFSQLEERLRIETEELNNLKAQISTSTKDDISVEWETSIQHLQAKRVTTSTDYRNTTAGILAGILVNEQLELIRAQEEVEIKKGVESAEVVGPVNRITGIYSSLNYDDGKILVNDEYKQFALSNLSTGAREQVLLGLRLGFAARLLRDESLFLLLDDAFQHADWERRDLLIAKMVDLAKEGWQIVYFTMDDDIRDRFMKAGEQNFAGQFMYRNINPGGSSPPVSG